MMDICTLTEPGLRLRLDKWFECLIGGGKVEQKRRLYAEMLRWVVFCMGKEKIHGGFVSLFLDEPDEGGPRGRA